MLRAHFLSFAIALIAGSLVLGQAPSPDPVPTWPESGQIPLGLENQYVFLTPEKDAVFVLVPEVHGGLAGNKKPVRIPLRNQQVPSVIVSMQELPSARAFQVLTTSRDPSPQSSLGMPSPVWETAYGRYLYQYTIENAPSAKDAIEVWLFVASPFARLRGTPPAQSNWGRAIGGAYLPQMPANAPQLELRGAPNGRYITWSSLEEGSGIAPGESLAGFEIVSDYKPGFTTARFKQALFIDQHVPGDWPPEVHAQLDFLRGFGWGLPTLLTFGPMFAPDAPRDEIVPNIRSGIARLIETGRLDPESAFVKEVIAALQETPPPDGRESRILSAPSSELEAEIKEALRISLGLEFSPAKTP